MSNTENLGHEVPTWKAPSIWGPRGRTGRPDTPSSATSSRSRRSTLSQIVQFDEPDMCNPLASPRSDVTVTAVPVSAPVKSTNPKVGLPSGSVAGSSSQSLELPEPSLNKRNAFAQQQGKFPSHLSSHPSRSSLRATTLRSSSIPPVPPLPISILKNRPGNLTLTEFKPRSCSAPPSPPKMAGNPDFPDGNNKPLPVSPRYDLHTPSPRAPIFRRDDMHRPSLSSMERTSGVSLTTVPRSNLTLKDLPEAVRSLQYRYETDIQRLSKKIDNINKLEQKVDDFVTVTRDYIKDQMDAQLERQSDMSFEVTKAKLDVDDVKEQVHDLKEQVAEIKEVVHDMRSDINELTSSFGNLSAKVDMCLGGTDNPDEQFLAYQRRKNKEIDEDIEEIGSQTEDHGKQLLYLRQMLIRSNTALRVLQDEHGLKMSDDVERILPPNPLPARDTVAPTGTLRTRVSSGVGAISPATAAPPVPVAASATMTSPGSSSAKSSIPRRSKKRGSKKSASSSSAKETTEGEAAPSVPTIP
ncbi:hypothetical protein DTO013E5_103 [Penicillium roqueforti]|uniref:uncharacterized protein n=1 Tax=Penicillium roqueforti TaxID=5082 RepID=UPI00190CB63A|nr:uncharacterized protein LCP9604111_1034 [Penicillium roqueforti]KAF9253508.1 hypothetical protein LCP9604111_1034 [Penicillium roqueforti]KAI2746691.1 hypothetical protein DTO012A1_1522 [Penicillium roqueforti]KAI2757108.1 hypothetical protein DTO013F2_523 [Penicillium roqueforti]KAI3142828.1 hypothetical protein CBS147330_615 [Penicillium roqueforti]KAI3218264.1 hypothetical protein DTO013E5_103 [Penicillium roqueforti]